jgi:aspartate-semialdehyde dehydrogenase
MKLAVVGVTGLVGTVINEVLEEFNIPITQYIPVASENSIGKLIKFKNNSYQIIGIEQAIELKPNVAIFSAGGATSLKYAPEFAKNGTFVIDNSSAWRMDKTKKLIVPEINAKELQNEDKIIANPNCSTIQMVMALYPLHQKYEIERIVVSTYQSFTGTGVKAVSQYNNEKNNESVSIEDMAYKYPIFENCIPHCDVFLDNGYTKEEMKLVHETRKIMSDEDLKITATAVRVPVNGGHSESINVSFKSDIDIEEVKSILRNTAGLNLLDNPEKAEYPMPLFAKNKNEVFVGRVREDESQKNTINLWVVADNLRKGAATNAVQIVEYLYKKGMIA